MLGFMDLCFGWTLGWRGDPSVTPTHMFVTHPTLPPPLLLENCHPHLLPPAAAGAAKVTKPPTLRKGFRTTAAAATPAWLATAALLT